MLKNPLLDDDTEEKSPLVNGNTAPSLNLAGGAPSAQKSALTPAPAPAPAPASAPAPTATKEQPMTAIDLFKKQAITEQEITENAAKQQENIIKGDEDKAKVAAETAKDIGKIELKKGLLKAPETQQIPYKPTKPTSPVDQWGSFAMAFAMLGSLFTRNHAVTALNSAAAAMNGFKQGDEAAAKQGFDEWRVANDNMLKTAEFQRKVYDQAFKGYDTEEKLLELKGTQKEKEIEASVKAANLALQHTNAEKIRSENGLPATLRLLDLEQKQAEGAAKQGLVIQTLMSPEYSEMMKSGDELGAAKLLAEKTKDPEAIRSYEKLATSKLLLDQQKAAAIKAARNSDDYKKADPAGKLAILADAGDARAAVELDRVTAKQAVQKLDGSVSAEEQRINDEAIANYSSPPPPTSKSKEGRDYYNATMARVRAINNSYDPGNYRSAVNIRQHWMDSANKSGGQIQTYNTISHHLKYLDEMANALKTQDQGAWNRAATSLGSAFAMPDLDVTNIRAAQHALADEITKGILGSSGALTDRETMAKLFDPTQPLSVLKSNIDVLKNMTGGRLSAAQQSFITGTQLGKEEFQKLLQPETRDLFRKDLGVSEAPRKSAEAAPNETPAPSAAGGATEPPVYKVGDEIMSKGHRYKVTKLRPDGTVLDADPVISK